MEICWDLPTVLNIKQGQCDEERLHLPRAQKKQITTMISMLQLSNILTEVLRITLVVGPCSFSATQLCRLNDRSLHFTRIRFPNFSSNGLISGSIPEKSNFCMQTHPDILTAPANTFKSSSSNLRKTSAWLSDCQFYLLILSLLPVCLHPMWRALAEFHFSS